MSGFIGPRGRIERRLGCNLWGSSTSPFLSKNYAPGQHGKNRKRQGSDYSIQLLAKQKLRNYYNMREKQFRGIYVQASKMSGSTSDRIVDFLERRLASVVYRMKFAPTVMFARQIVSHGHVLVNGRVVKASSFSVRNGDLVELGPNMRNNNIVAAAIDNNAVNIPTYIIMENKFAGKLLASPKIKEIPYACQMDPLLVVNYYSR